MTSISYETTHNDGAAASSASNALSMASRLALIREWVSLRMLQSKTERALNALSDRDLRDIGITRDMIRNISRGASL